MAEDMLTKVRRGPRSRWQLADAEGSLAVVAAKGRCNLRTLNLAAVLVHVQDLLA